MCILLENLQFIEIVPFFNIELKIVFSCNIFIYSISADTTACWDYHFSLLGLSGPPLSEGGSWQAPLCGCLLSSHCGWSRRLHHMATAPHHVRSISCDASESISVGKPAWSTQDCGRHIGDPLVIGVSGKSPGGMQHRWCTPASRTVRRSAVPWASPSTVPL